MLSNLLVDFADSDNQEPYFIEAISHKTRKSFRVASACAEAPDKGLISKTTLAITTS
jgi:hypothetical protein